MKDDIRDGIRLVHVAICSEELMSVAIIEKLLFSLFLLIKILELRLHYRHVTRWVKCIKIPFPFFKLGDRYNG